MRTKNKLILTKNGYKILILNCSFKRYRQIEQKQNVNYAKKQWNDQIWDFSF